ncbi:MAG TPA: phenylalanine 4-monooxygenase [Allosphingosinicella sp.]
MQISLKERHGAAASPSPPPGAAADWTVPQHWDAYDAEDHAVWDILFARQQRLLAGRAVDAFHQSLDVLRLSRPGIPRLQELNERLSARTGWQVVAVPGLVPDDVFFRHLSERRFPAGNFIRRRHELDYLEEPDIFHDLFGHVPLLAQPAVADFMQALGELGLCAIDRGVLHRLGRLYWYTVEFGLTRGAAGGLRIHGAGLLSSFGEARRAVESPIPVRRPFDLRTAIRTPYRNDAMQPLYFVVERFEDMLGILEREDFMAVCAEVADLPDLAAEG